MEATRHGHLNALVAVTDLKELAAGFTQAAREVSRAMKYMAAGIASAASKETQQETAENCFSEAQKGMHALHRCLADNYMLCNLTELGGQILSAKSAKILEDTRYKLDHVNLSDKVKAGEGFALIIGYLNGQLDMLLSMSAETVARSD